MTPLFSISFTRNLVLLALAPGLVTAAARPDRNDQVGEVSWLSLRPSFLMSLAVGEAGFCAKYNTVIRRGTKR